LQFASCNLLLADAMRFDSDSEIMMLP